MSRIGWKSDIGLAQRNFYSPRVWKLVLSAVLAACLGCAPAEQESVRTVAAIEVPLLSDADRLDLIAILHRHAALDGGLHVDDVTDRWRELEANSNTVAPAEQGTIFVGVWRGADYDEPVADVDDIVHPGRAWVTFSRVKKQKQAAKFREAVLAEIKSRWPDARPIPILPTGGVPLPHDLTKTSDGYRIKRAAASTYELPMSSPLVASE